MVNLRNDLMYLTVVLYYFDMFELQLNSYVSYNKYFLTEYYTH